jgi:carboxylesterase type B
MSCLRTASVGAIVSAVNHRVNCKFLPVIDGTFLTDLPSNLIQAGKMLNVNFIGGHTTDDGSVFVGDPSKILTEEDFVKSILKRYTGLVKGFSSNSKRVKLK